MIHISKMQVPCSLDRILVVAWGLHVVALRGKMDQSAPTDFGFMMSHMAPKDTSDWELFS